MKLFHGYALNMRVRFTEIAKKSRLLSVIAAKLKRLR